MEALIWFFVWFFVGAVIGLAIYIVKEEWALRRLLKPPAALWPVDDFETSFDEDCPRCGGGAKQGAISPGRPIEYTCQKGHKWEASQHADNT